MNRMNWMRRLAVVGLGLWAATLGGCVVKVGGNVDDEKPWRDEVRKSPPPVVVMPANTEDAATLAEIDAAAKMSFDSGRVPALKNVAARPSLSPAAQVHLINTSLRSLSFDAGRIDVLLALIENPGFSAAGKEAIFRQIERLDFDASRQRVMSAIQEKSARP